MNGCDIAGKILEDGQIVPILIATSIVLAVLFKTVASVISNVSRERTRREIAAYIAEGSMTPEQGERLMRSGSDKSSGCC